VLSSVQDITCSSDFGEANFLLCWAETCRRDIELATGIGRVRSWPRRALEVEIQAWHGQDPADGHWGWPLREQWKLSPHQQMSPGWMEKPAFTVTATAS
jgi:hypothetical protein